MMLRRFFSQSLLFAFAILTDINCIHANTVRINKKTSPVSFESSLEQSKEQQLPAGITICDGSAPVGDVAAYILQQPIPYCMNYGTCRPEYADHPESPCLCPDGYEGVHCEFVNGTAPTCDLTCFAGGTCQLGAKTFELVVNQVVDVQDLQYCQCPPDTVGDLCEREAARCGAAGTCLHGGRCVTVNDTDSYCDCTTAVTSNLAFAGQYCENQASAVCSDTADHNGRHFCVNGGVCKGDSHLGCDCPTGFIGPICEFHATQYLYSACTLECQNGGICRKGAKDVSFLKKFDLHRGLLGQQYDENFQSCVCPYGYVGLNCEYEIDVCPGQQKVCMHGGRCNIVLDNVTGEPDAECDCEYAETESSRFTGLYCNVESTEFCTIDGAKTSGGVGYDFYCTNGGTCQNSTEDIDEGFLGCNCPIGYYGRQCELTENVQSQSTETRYRLIGVSAGMVAVACCLIAFTARQHGGYSSKLDPIDTYYTEGQNRQNKPSEPWMKEKSINRVSTRNLQDFRRDDDDEEHVSIRSHIPIEMSNNSSNKSQVKKYKKSVTFFNEEDVKHSVKVGLSHVY